MKRFVFRLLLLAATALVSLLILEKGLRAFFPFYDPRRQIVFEESPEWGCALGPAGQTIRQRTPKGDYDLPVHFSRDGLREERALATSTAGDLFVVGDSFSMGWGVETHERYAGVLEQQTGRRVFCLGIPNDLQGYAGLVRYARARGATISNLVVGVCMNNDLRNYEQAGKPLTYRYGDPSRRVARARAWLQAHSALYLYLSFEIQRHRVLRKACEKLGISRDINEITLRNLYDPDVLAASRRQVARMKGVMPDRTLLLIIPSLALWEGDNQETERRIHDGFVALLSADGHALLDMRPVLEATGDPRGHYFETDPHWNARGHALAGQALAKHLAP